MKITLRTTEETHQFGQRIGQVLRGGEVIELIGDVGAGKTTLTKAIASGLEIDEDVQSPSFTLSREYDARDGLRLHHYDFYRLIEPGIMSYELAESLTDDKTVTVVEWADTVSSVLPKERIVIRLQSDAETEARHVDIEVPRAWDYLGAAL